MTHRYLNSKNKHISYNLAEDFKGTPSYSSLTALKGYVQGRRDDLEAISYVLFYIYLGELPWQKYRSIKDHNKRVEAIIESKENIFSYDFIKDSPKCLTEFHNYTRLLRFKENPDYEYLKSLFRNGESLEFKKNSSVRIVLEEVKEEVEDDGNLNLILWNNVSNRSYTPNYSDVEQKYIKSLS